MTRLLIIVFWGLLTIPLGGCGRPQTVDTGVFTPYVERFKDAAAASGNPVHITDLVMKFGDISNSQERALCTIADGQPPTIVIRQDIWENIDDAEREAMVFHELGHCVLHRLHLPGLDNNGDPVSLMDPFAFPGSIYQAKKSYYDQELFQPTNTF